MKAVLNIIISTTGVLVATYILPHVHVDSIWYALLLAVVLSALNALVKPLLILLTLPATILSLGFFLLVVNAVIILLADYLIDGFRVDGFWWALLFSIVLSIINGILNKIINGDNNRHQDIEIR